MSGAQTQAAPRGMQRIPFPTESYQSPSPPLSAKWLRNMMIEQQPADARTQAALVPTPGLTVERVVGGGPIHLMDDTQPGFVYLVSGTRFYRMTLGLTGVAVEDLGDIGAPATDVLPSYAAMYSIGVSSSACVVCSPPHAYTTANGVGSPLNQITGATWPGAQSVAAFDNYHVFVSYENSAKFFVSHLLDPSSFDALDFSYTDALPNVLRRIFPYRTDLWMMGEGGIEIWYDSGDVDFPFRRRLGGVIPYAIGSPQSVAAGDTSIFWVSNNNVVYRSQQYQASRISTHAIEQIIAELGTYAIVSAFTYTQVGHVFYALNWPARTLVYDCATKQWHDRASGTGRWRANAIAHAVGGAPWFGDAQSGTIWTSEVNSTAAGSEAAAPIQRQIVFPPIWAGTNRAFCSRIEVEMESGDPRVVGGAVTLDWSDDGGFTWGGGPRTMAVGPGRRQRVVATRLGSFRQRVFRLSFSGAAVVYGMDAEITGGAS